MSQLVKAKLTSSEATNIEFMFNPAELVFEGVVETSENPGARVQETGKPKVSFSNVKAYKVTIGNILFDCYEQRKDVVRHHISPFREAVQFVGNEQRPPIYRFEWGSHVYLQRCFVEQLTYKLTLFLPDGTPVRAVIDSLTLKEVDEPQRNTSMAPNGTPDRVGDSLATRQQ
ncbi:MAG: hypothetical protein ACFB8W_10920 [Elainellaceae cyanobacterium]